MSEIKALNNLRAFAVQYHPNIKVPLDEIADEIQAEVDERERLLKQNTSVTEDYYKDMIAEMYMPLPLDRDGAPIRVGDMIEYEGEEDTYTLHARGVYVFEDGHVAVMNERLGIWYPENCRHVKSRTLEDVLRDLEGMRGNYADYEDVVCRAAKYAAEIRELLGVDA